MAVLEPLKALNPLPIVSDSLWSSGAAAHICSSVFSDLQSSKLELVDGTKVTGYAHHSVSLLFVVELI
jgi:hypothetical protein